MDGSPSSQILRPQPRRPATLSLTPISNTSNENSPNDQSPADLSSEPETPSPMGSRKNRPSDTTRRTHPDLRDIDTTSETLQPPQKSRSILNLTSSTLFGIYAPNSYESARDEPLTPFGTGAQTPARSTGIDTRSKGTPVFTPQAFREKDKIGKERQRERRKSMQQQKQHWRRASASSQALNMIMRAALLFAFGVAYGQSITILHNSGHVAPVQLHRINRSSWIYLAFWGLTGVLLGFAVPYLDRMQTGRAYKRLAGQDEDEDIQAEQDTAMIDEGEDEAFSIGGPTRLAADWSDIVRSIGAFVGIAFAIRKLSWQSTLQVSLTLALVNPMIWYLIDRTRNGLTLASMFGLLGASALISINPQWIPAPATASAGSSQSSWAASNIAQPGPKGPGGSRDELLAGIVSYESIGVATWISSVLFCSCIFFGNVGRRLRHS